MKFKLTYIVIPIAIFLTGCDNRLHWRNTPQQQAEDMEVCRKANMDAFLNGQSEIRCSPKDREYANFKK